jgi:hypothetical protein
MDLEINEMKKRKRKSFIIPITVRITKDVDSKLAYLLEKHQIDRAALVRRGIENMIVELLSKLDGEKAA